MKWINLHDLFIVTTEDSSEREKLKGALGAFPDRLMILPEPNTAEPAPPPAEAVPVEIPPAPDTPPVVAPDPTLPPPPPPPVVLPPAPPPAPLPTLIKPYEGFGSTATGGSNEFFVTSKANSGAGTLRDAFSVSGRLIKFSVDGDINITSNLVVPSNTTIDGFTAPGPNGITIRGRTLDMSNKTNIIARGIRVRDAVGQDVDCVRVFNSTKVMLSNLSADTFDDGGIDVTEFSKDVTVQWCIIGPGNPAAQHNFLSLAGAIGATRVTSHHNLYFGGTDRNPSVNSQKGVLPEISGDVRNNLIWRYTQTGSSCRQDGKGNFINNYYYTHLNTGVGNTIRVMEGGQAYCSGNVSKNGYNPNSNSNVSQPWPASMQPVLQSAISAAHAVRAGAGARCANFGLDAADQSYIDQITDLEEDPTPPPVGGGAPVPPPSVAPIFLHSFETSVTEGGAYSIQAASPSRISLVNFGRVGARAVQMRTLSGDTNIHGSGSRKRTELSLGVANTGNVSEGTEQWWAHSVYLPDGWVSPTGAWWSQMAGQFHHTGSSGSANVNFMIWYDPGTAPEFTVRIYGGPSVGANFEFFRFTGMGPAQRNVWYDFVYNVRWSTGNSGFFKVWGKKWTETDYKLVANRVNKPTMYTGMGVYFKVGSYHNKVIVSDDIIYDRIVRGTSADSVAIGGAARLTG